MSVDGSLGYFSHETIHSSSHRSNYDEISEEESIELSSGDVNADIDILWPSTLPLSVVEVIIVVMLVVVDIGQKIPATISLPITEKGLMLMV